MRNYTPIEELCLCLQEANPEMFSSKHVAEADKEFDEAVYQTLAKQDKQFAGEVDELHTMVALEYQMMGFVIGYVTARDLDICAANVKKAIQEGVQPVCQ